MRVSTSFHIQISLSFPLRSWINPMMTTWLWLEQEWPSTRLWLLLNCWRKVKRQNKRSQYMSTYYIYCWTDISSLLQLKELTSVWSTRSPSNPWTPRPSSTTPGPPEDASSQWRITTMKVRSQKLQKWNELLTMGYFILGIFPGSNQYVRSSHS